MCRPSPSYEQILSHNDAHVSGDHVSRGELDHVTRNEPRNRNLQRLAVTDDGGRDRDHGPEFGGSTVGSGLLDEFQSNAQHDHQRHHEPGAGIAGRERNASQHGQQ